MALYLFIFLYNYLEHIATIGSSVVLRLSTLEVSNLHVICLKLYGNSLVKKKEKKKRTIIILYYYYYICIFASVSVFLWLKM